MEWISVKDRLPENQQYVLVHYDKRITDMDKNWHWSERELRTFISRIDEDTWVDENKDDVVEPTHWMPLPEAPSN